MFRVFLMLCLFASSVNITSSALGAAFSHLMNIRCEFSDSFLKSAFKFYDELIASSIVSFYFLKKNENPEKVSRIDGAYKIEGFDNKKPTRVIIHGFWNSHKSKINKAMKEAYSNHYNVNLIIVNYSRISRDVCYKIARSRVGLLGRKIAAFLDSVLDKDEWQWKNLVIVGHSLGGHTAGGRLVRNGRVGAIVALDPAAPGFKNDSETRLRSDDAEYVECLHTNGDNLGLMEPICKVDIYPNFGLNQPGCSFVTKDLCSHSRAWKLFAESLVRNFSGYKCESEQDIYNNVPCNGKSLTLGGDDYESKVNMSGIFYLSTNSDPPYSKG